MRVTPIDPSMMRRLVVAKYVFTQAIHQSRDVEPRGGLSVLGFHDAAEMFLYIATEQVGTAKKDMPFLKYWDVIGNKVKGFPTQLAGMTRLNNARVGLKHYGTLPSRGDIESFRVTTTNFFQENTPAIFGIDFDDISLVDLIHHEATRNELRKCEAHISDDNLGKAMASSAIAFAELIRQLDNEFRGTPGRSAFHFGPYVLHSDFLHTFERSQDAQFSRLISEVTQSIDAIRGATRMLAFGVDYRRYAKFVSLTPVVHRPPGIEGYGVQYLRSSDSITEAEVRYCIDFVIDCALRFQEHSHELAPDSS